MAVCPSCGRENADDARFCSACGAALREAETPREQRKVVTVLFCDLVGSTALGESTDPEALRARMQSYFGDLRAIVERHGGTVEKFVGDAVMAVFGIPTAHEDDALRAVRAASEMREAIGAHGLEARIGINTGEVVVGGEGETLVTGDAVNVAARLEQAAPTGETLIGAETRLLVRDAVRVEPAARLELKGKSEPVEAFRLLEVVADADAVARHLERPLVGRDRERERLWRDYEDAVADRGCRLFTLLGPAGIGKSRLVADFLERIGDAADVLRGRCLSYGEGITYWPLVEMLVPAGIDPESVVASTPQETRVAFRRLLEERAAQRPQVVVVDDLQWAEPVFVDLVEHVADLSRDAPIFLLCIARTELLDVRPQWGGGKLNATSLLLEPLDARECELLMTLVSPDAALDPTLRERITAASAGNPLFVEEMLAMVREHEGGRGQVAVPPTIQALLQARIDSLGGDVRAVLECAAVEGEVFHRGALASLVADDAGADLETQLSSLVRMELIRPDTSLVPGEDAFRFRHILIRDAAYAALPKVLRAELHERYAGWLEGRNTPSSFEVDELLGYHLEQAQHFRVELGSGDDDLAARASARLLAAGQGALGRADLPAAAGLLERAVDLGGDRRTHLHAMFALAQVLVRRGELERADALLPAVIEAAREAGDDGILARARLAYNSLRARIDTDARVEAELEEALEIAASLEGSGELAALVTAHGEIGTCKFQLGRAGEGEHDLARAVEIASATGDSALIRDTMAARLRPAGWGPMPAPEGVALCEELIAADYANASLRSQALQILALFQAMRGELELSRRAAADAWSLIEEFDMRLVKGIYSCDVGSAELIAREFDRAELLLRRGHDALVEMGDVGVRSTIDGLLSDVLFLQGRHDEALALADESGAIAAADDLDSQPRSRAARARVLASRGELDEALGLLEEAVELADSTDFLELAAYVHEVHAEVLARAGLTDDAHAAIRQAVALYEQKGNVVSAGRMRAVLDGLRAEHRS
jgi:class 3 adenylate cyclase/tetratricopeptide (TPR) repeat protein